MFFTKVKEPPFKMLRQFLPVKRTHKEFPSWLSGKWSWLASMRTKVLFLDSLSGLRIWRCHELMRLASCIAVAMAWASGYSSNSPPHLGTPMCSGLGHQKKGVHKSPSVKRYPTKNPLTKQLCRWEVMTATSPMDTMMLNRAETAVGIKMKQGTWEFCIHTKNWWSSCCGSTVTNPTISMRIWVWSLASLSGLRIHHYDELWYRWQMRLGSHVAVAVAVV